MLWRAMADVPRARWVARSLQAAACVVLGWGVGSPRPVHANGFDLEDLTYNSDQPARIIFPNNTALYMGSFTLQITYQTTSQPEEITGLTVVNFGSAGPGDISAVYFRAFCAKGDTGILPLTFAGTYTEGDITQGPQVPRPAWTWAGLSPNFDACADTCGCNPCCGPFVTIQLYADIAPCATQGATVDLGFPFNNASTTTWGGSISDNGDTYAPWADTDRGGNMDTIQWAVKQGAPSDFVAPGDTVSYTIFYGRPGANPLTSIVVYDTLPTYSHYLTGSAVPPPDPGWDPAIGPPNTLRWTFPGPLATAGGPTAVITFQATVDWGNMESFEPGSGDLGAPEGTRLVNQAQAFFNGTSCAVTSAVTPPVNAVVRRLLFWMLTDNDMLFASSFGMPPDAITYSLSLKNMSGSKTWWNLSIWDTVPPALDVWCTGCGLADPCVGWTMTPTGCAAYAPGSKQTGGGKTMMTWTLDLPPGATLTLQWKGQVKGSAASGTSNINIASVQETGRTGVVGGTGNSLFPRNFTHLALIVLRTTYVSYLGYAGNCTCNNKCGLSGFNIDFFPLNQQTQIELFGIEYQGAGWATTGGISQSIGCLIGDCLNGWTGNASCGLGSGPITGGGNAGCKAERIPARYVPTAWQGVCPAFPFNFIYKIVSNSPVVWQMASAQLGCNMDWPVFSPATTMTFQGFKLYTWVPELADQDGMVMINTGLDANNAFSATQETGAFMFRFNYATNQWEFQYAYQIGGESEVTQMFLTANGDNGPWMVISSDTRMLVYGAWNYLSTAGCCSKSGSDNGGTLSPTRESGLTVGGAGSHFYNIGIGIACGQGLSREMIGAAGAAGSTIKIWTYTPNNTLNLLPTQAPNAPASTVSPLLRDSIGSWSTGAAITMTGGLATSVSNPLIYGRAYNGYGPFERGGSNLFKVEVVSGGPIQVYSGTDMFGQWGGGNVLHSPVGVGGTPGPYGTQFWLHQPGGDSGACGVPFTDWFTPKSGQTIQAVSSDGYLATYTTNAADQCVSFQSFTDPGSGVRRNMEFSLIGGGGAMMGLYNQCSLVEKGYTAPFMAAGVHYTVIAPPVVYVGQSFWITVLVESGLGGTESDYCGTSSFTSTDPAAQMMGSPMDVYNYTWTSSVAPCGVGTDNGVKIFVNVVLSVIGVQTIVAQDTIDGSITGLAPVTVVGVDVKLLKTPALRIAASGDTVQFKICWSNYSSASAFSFTITDAVPQGTVYVPEVPSAMECGDTDGATYQVAYSTVAQGTPPATWTTLPGGSQPPATTQWLRWTFAQTGVQTTGCACYRVAVQ